MRRPPRCRTSRSRPRCPPGPTCGPRPRTTRSDSAGPPCPTARRGARRARDTGRPAGRPPVPDRAGRHLGSRTRPPYRPRPFAPEARRKGAHAVLAPTVDPRRTPRGPPSTGSTPPCPSRTPSTANTLSRQSVKAGAGARRRRHGLPSPVARRPCRPPSTAPPPRCRTRCCPRPWTARTSPTTAPAPHAPPGNRPRSPWRKPRRRVGGGADADPAARAAALGHRGGRPADEPGTYAREAGRGVVDRRPSAAPDAPEGA